MTPKKISKSDNVTVYGNTTIQNWPRGLGAFWLGYLLGLGLITAISTAFVVGRIITFTKGLFS